MVGAVGADRQHGAADHPCPNVIWIVEQESPFEDPSLAQRFGEGPKLVPTAWDLFGDDANRREAAEDIDHELNAIIPDNGSESAEHGVDNRNDPHHDHAGREGPVEQRMHDNSGQEQPQCVAQVARHQE